MRPIATTLATGETGWVFFSLVLHLELAAAHVLDPQISFLLGPQLQDGHHASSYLEV